MINLNIGNSIKYKRMRGQYSI